MFGKGLAQPDICLAKSMQCGAVHAVTNYMVRLDMEGMPRSKARAYE